VKTPNAQTANRPSVTPQTVTRKNELRVTISHGSRDQEIENIKRLLANISQRIDKLK
jgi:hypothetical protein